MKKFIYFAYGSNMLVSRLTARCPSARAIGAAWVPGHEVSFSLPSAVDGSGKAGIREAANDKAWGVLYEISLDHRIHLDVAESHGEVYDRHDTFEVIGPGGQHYVSATYKPLQHGVLPPYDWYLALCVAGAEQNGLPDQAIEQLRAVRAIPDPNPDREGRRIALKALHEAGRSDLPSQLLR